MDTDRTDSQQIKFRLVIDMEEEEFVEGNILPIVEDIIERYEVFNLEALLESLKGLKTEESLLLYLSDDQLKDLLPRLAGSGIKIAVLPHPQAREACLGMGVDRSLEKAIDHLKDAPQPIKTDVLFCNGRPVFNNMVVGQTFKLTSEDLSKSNGFWKRKLNYIGRFFNIKPFRVDVDLPNGKKLKTSVAGIVVSEHRKNFFISRLVLADSSVNDGKMHAFLIIPRSIVEMFRFAIRSLWEPGKFPSFGAHIKTTKISLSFPDGERDFLVDKEKLSSQNIDLHIGKEQIDIIPGANLELPGSLTESAEIFKVKALPAGEAAEGLSGRKLPLIRHASFEEFKELFQILRENARLKNSYLVLMVLSTVLATFGLFADSTPVVIGAMILAPLMSPIISLSMGALRQDKMLITNSFVTILAGLGLSLVFAVLITWLTPIQSAGSEILARTRPNLLDLGIAVVSGIAGAYAHAREEVAKTLAGVAIAVALIPPLAVAAIGIGWADWSIFFGATLLFATNLAGMVLTASLTFMLLGFSPFKLAKKGMGISLLLVLLLCIPLALGFKQMVYEHQVKKQLEDLQTEIANIKDVKVQNLSPMKISLKLVSENPIGAREIDLIKTLIEDKVKQSVEIEVVTVISR
ncbi:MAG: TIGR00341 family protein [Anditalea sp.]